MCNFLSQIRGCLAWIIVLLVFMMPHLTLAWSNQDAEDLLKRMETAYGHLKDYQARVEVRTSRKDRSTETQIFLYTFKKPNRIRLDFESPHRGLVMVYPDQNGEVVVRPTGLIRFFKLHLAPDNPLLATPSGQRIDQTEMGLLIQKIGHSMTDQRLGSLNIRENDETIEIQVLAFNHFRKGVVTLYRFTIDKKLELPVKVEESDTGGHPERTVAFHNLRTNIAIPDSLFELGG